MGKGFSATKKIRIENHQSQSSSMTFWTARETNTEEHCFWLAHFSRSQTRCLAVSDRLILPSWFRGRPFNSWGAGRVGDFEKKIPASACWKKKIACSTNDIEKNSCTAASKKKKCCKAISSGLYKIPAKLQPFSGWFLMRLHFCIRICLKFFSPGRYVITKGTLPLVC